MPFRSDGEQLREKIRRVEEEARELLEEQSALERQVKLQEVAAGGRSLIALLVAIVAVAATTFIGFETGTLEAEKRAARRIEQLERDEVAQLDVGRASHNTCSREHERATTETSACRSDVTDLQRRLRILSSQGPRDDAAGHLR